MVTRRVLSDYLSNTLACDQFDDYAPNGLQVEGADDINAICTAVTASEDVILQALKCKAQALIVHHGYFWKGESRCVTGMIRRRLTLLLTHALNLFAYHLPLDCHPLLGNNFKMGELLDVAIEGSFKVDSTPNLLWMGACNKAWTIETYATRLSTLFQRDPLVISGGDHLISRVAWCTGAAQDLIIQAKALGVDAFISGEISERTFYQAKELGIHYFSCGHHATERLGIQALGSHLEQRFGLSHTFIDSENPV